MLYFCILTSKCLVRLNYPHFSDKKPEASKLKQLAHGRVTKELQV